MRPKIGARAVSLAVFLLATVPIMPQAAIAAAPGDACALLTAGQISSVVGVSVGAGAYVTPTFKKTCTWTGHDMIVTLFLESLPFYQAGKRAPLASSASGVGDEAYYAGVGSTMSLVVKKGSAAFKVSVYAKIPADRKQAMEMTLARDVVSKL